MIVLRQWIMGRNRVAQILGFDPKYVGSSPTAPATNFVEINELEHECDVDCKHDSDCSLHNRPAFKREPCDCSGEMNNLVSLFKESEIDIWECICGCQKFYLYRDGVVQCADCDLESDAMICGLMDDVNA